ncbi:hypothetical protein Drose_15785 [Dactylosporangium roseum]|uniref:MmyB-like transcription regulator ligand binding domain-containing protein n=1 Tax=Dactylosporangium roseum TaxID=47989 RepID=A0ABY5ZD23_9ACTN|nr:hypothetical protein Drose_15785 [Dactylosporangium roseum]
MWVHWPRGTADERVPAAASSLRLISENGEDGPGSVPMPSNATFCRLATRLVRRPPHLRRGHHQTHPANRPARPLTRARSHAFRRRWSAHNVCAHGAGRKHIHHRDVDDLELAYESMDWPRSPGLSSPSTPPNPPHRPPTPSKSGSPVVSRTAVLAGAAAHPRRGEHLRADLATHPHRGRPAARRHLHRPGRHLPPDHRAHQGPARPVHRARDRPAQARPGRHPNHLTTEPPGQAIAAASDRLDTRPVTSQERISARHLPDPRSIQRPYLRNSGCCPVKGSFAGESLPACCFRADGSL